MTFCLQTLASKRSIGSDNLEAVFWPWAEQAMPQENNVSFRCVISSMLNESLVCCRCCSRRADQNIAYADLAAAVALTMITSYSDQHAAEFRFAAHQNIFPRNEDIVENHQGFMTAKQPTSIVPPSSLRVSQECATGEMRKQFFVRRADKRYGVIRVILAHGNRRHD